MKRIQKIAWVFVITISIAVISATIATVVLYIKFGMPKASAGLAFLAIAGIGGFAPLFIKKDPGPVEFDERDKEIGRRAALAGFAAAYLLVGLSCMIPFTIYGYDKMVRITWLPMIFAAAGIAHYFFYSVAILIQYGKGGKENE
jgi:hypothetical protein